MLCALFDRLTRPVLISVTVLCTAPALAGGSLLASEPARASTAAMVAGGAADRVAAATQVRTRAERFHAAACGVEAGIVPDARTTLIVARREMAHLLDALEHGNPAIGIDGAETRRKTLRKLHDVRAMWEGMRRSVNVTISDGAEAEALQEMALFRGILHETATQLLTEVSGQYSHPYELMQADALAIDFASRQAFWAERVALATCELWMGRDADLPNAMAHLTTGLAALDEGLPELDLDPAPTEAIKAELTAIRAEWTALVPFVLSVAAQRASPEEAGATLSALAGLAARLEDVAADYTAHAKRRS